MTIYVSILQQKITFLLYHHLLYFLPSQFSTPHYKNPFTLPFCSEKPLLPSNSPFQLPYLTVCLILTLSLFYLSFYAPSVSLVSCSVHIPHAFSTSYFLSQLPPHILFSLPRIPFSFPQLAFAVGDGISLSFSLAAPSIQTVSWDYHSFLWLKFMPSPPSILCSQSSLHNQYSHTKHIWDLELWNL